MQETKVIYTVLTGGKDNLREQPKFKGWEYLAFTDREYDSKTWKVIQYPSEQTDLRRKSREPKIRPELYFNYDKSVYIDANIDLLVNPDEYIKEGIGLSSHPFWQCIYREASEIIKRGLDQPTNVQKSLELYKKIKYPPNNGFYANYIIARQRSKKIYQLDKMWQLRYNEGSVRDQMTLLYCMEVIGIKPYVLKPNIIKRHRHIR